MLSALRTEYNNAAISKYKRFVQLPEPKQAQAYQDREYLDMNEYLNTSAEGSFLMKVRGDSMIGAGIHAGDILLADKNLEAKTGSIVIAAINGKLTVKRLKIAGNKIELAPENPDYAAIPVNDDDTLEIWGVVTNVIKSL
jgi:DNA polymerase V